MKLLKKYISKKRFKEKNKQLRALLFAPKQIHTIERNAEKVMASFEVPAGEEIPEEVIKFYIANKMVQFLQPLIEYDFLDNEHGGKTCYGNLYVANKGRLYE